MLWSELFEMAREMVGENIADDSGEFFKLYPSKMFASSIQNQASRAIRCLESDGFFAVPIMQGVETYDLPADFLEAQQVEQGTNSLIQLTKRPIDVPYSTGIPTHFYVAGKKLGLWPKPSEAITPSTAYQLNTVNLVQVGPLSACTAAGSGIGKTLTVNAAEGAFVADGVEAVLGNRVLIKDQVAEEDNGVYTVTTLGDATTQWELTRAIDNDSTAEAAVDLWCYVVNGLTQAKTGWKISTAPAALDTNPMLWTEIEFAKLWYRRISPKYAISVAQSYATTTAATFWITDTAVELRVTDSSAGSLTATLLFSDYPQLWQMIGAINALTVSVAAWGLSARLSPDCSDLTLSNTLEVVDSPNAVNVMGKRRNLFFNPELPEEMQMPILYNAICYFCKAGDREFGLAQSLKAEYENQIGYFKTHWQDRNLTPHNPGIGSNRGPYGTRLGTGGWITHQ